MSFEIKNNKLVVLPNVILPPICVRTGRDDIPLVYLEWRLRIGGLVRAKFGYFMAADEKKRIELESRGKTKMMVYALIGLVLFIECVIVSTSSNSTDAIVMSVIVLFGLLILSSFLWRAYANSEVSSFISARLAGASFGFGSDRILISDLRAETMSKMVAVGPVTVAPIQPKRRS